jgi:hypothetical protein
MFEMLLLDPTVVTAILDVRSVRDLAHHIDCNALLYLGAATVARFWHEHIWMVYVAMAYTTILGLHH